MQASAGNQAVISFLNQAQTKLEVGAANDPLEAEADRLADRVVRSLGTSSSEPTREVAEGASTLDVRRAAEPSDVGPEGGEIEPEVERAIHSARGTGRPLQDGVRQDMEGAFGADLSGVRIHTGSQSDVLNRKLQARAFTVGTDIFFRGSAPDTSTSPGQHLLAHELAHTVQQRAVPIVQRDTVLTGEQKQQYEDMGNMSEYTKRTAPITKAKEGGINEALAVLPRNPDGSLTPEAMAAIEAFGKGEWDNNYSKWMDQRMPDPEKKKKMFGGIESDKDYRKRVAAAAKKLLGGTKNKVTGNTKNPELANLEGPNGEVDANVAEPFNFSGVTVTINYNKSDVNATERIAMVADSIKKILAAGGTLGNGLIFNLPKYGRQISVNADCTGVNVGDYGTRAVFVAPKYIHLSSEILGNPNEATEQTQGVDRLSYLSAQLDPDGVASIVHELGHYCHYSTSPSQFHLLNSTGWANKKATNLAMKVSMYAGGNPREFVAEVFLGLVYGRPFDDPTLAMYRGLGGMLIGAARDAAEEGVEAEAEALQ